MRYDFAMRWKRLSWAMLFTTAVAQTPVKQRAFDAAYIESTIIGDGEFCGAQKTLDEQTDPGGVVRDQVMKPIEHSIYAIWVASLPEEAMPPKLTKAISAVQFRVLADGKLESEKLVSSSGNGTFDQLAMKSVQIAKYPSFPNELGLRWITLRLNFLVNAKCGEIPSGPPS